jgi:hypothetical protein
MGSVPEEPLIEDGEPHAGDDRLRCLARLFLGPLAERRGRHYAAASPLVAASLAGSQRLDRAADPWWLYRFGPPGLAKAALDRVWTKALDC